MTDRPRVTVPRRAIPTMRLIADLSPERRELLEAALSQSPATASVSALKGRVASALGIEDDDSASQQASDLVGELFGLSALAVTHGYPSDGVADSVSETPDLELEDSRRTDFAAFFSRLLDSPAVATLGKAADLATEHDKVFHTGRIITELTPVFLEPSVEPAGAVISHRLRVSFWETGRESSVDITLNSAQLDELGNIVERAREKALSLESMLERVELPSFKTGRDGGGDE